MRIRRVRAAAAAFVLAAAALAAPPAPGQTATTTTHLFKIVHGAAWIDSDGKRYLTVGCAPLDRRPFGTEGSVVTLHLEFHALPRLQGQRPRVVWDSRIDEPKTPAGRSCDLRKGIDTVTFPIPAGLFVQDPNIPVVIVPPQVGFRVGGTHGTAMYRLRFARGAPVPPVPGQTTTTKHLLQIVHGAAWRGSDGNRYLTFGCAPLQRGEFGPEGSVVTLHLRFQALPRLPGRVHTVWDSRTSLPAGLPCDLRKGIDTVTFQIPEGLNLQDTYIPSSDYDRQRRGGQATFTVNGTHGGPMYGLRDYSGPLRGVFTPPPPAGAPD